MKSTAFLIAFALPGAAAMHGKEGIGGPGDMRTCSDAHGPGSNVCQRPGTCTAPTAKYSAVTTGPSPGLQWDISGGFCGSFSVQQGALSAGAWVSQDKVRKSNRDQNIPHNMHGDPTVGYEVMPSNVKYTADRLRFLSDEFDYTQPSPQANAWKKWAKGHLVQQHALVFFPMCKGDPHQCYPDSCPNGGSCDHVESMYGIFSQHPLNDTTVYPDDVVVHTSNQDCFPYYRKMSSLEDSTSMDGNCASAQPGFGKNEMYPCIDQSVTYGLAVTGLNVTGIAGKTSMTVQIPYEPNVRSGDLPTLIRPNITVTGLTASKAYTIYRYVGTETLPAGPPFSGATTTHKVTADAAGAASWDVAPPFLSNQAVYHFTA